MSDMAVEWGWVGACDARVSAYDCHSQQPDTLTCVLPCMSVVACVYSHTCQHNHCPRITTAAPPASLLRVLWRCSHSCLGNAAVGCDDKANTGE